MKSKKKMHKLPGWVRPDGQLEPGLDSWKRRQRSRWIQKQVVKVEE